MNGEVQDKVKVEVETLSHPGEDGEDEVEQTKVNIEMPAGHPDLELPDDPQEMLERARDMVEEANRIQPAESSRGKGKRKADEIAIDEDDVDVLGPDSKRAKTVQLELRKERIKRRAMGGIIVSLTIGYVSPHIVELGTLSLTFHSALVPSIMTAFGAS